MLQACQNALNGFRNACSSTTEYIANDVQRCSNYANACNHLDNIGTALKASGVVGLVFQVIQSETVSRSSLVALYLGVEMIRFSKGLQKTMTINHRLANVALYFSTSISPLKADLWCAFCNTYIGAAMAPLFVYTASIADAIFFTIQDEVLRIGR